MNKLVCVDKQFLYTLNIRAPDGSNTLINVTVGIKPPGPRFIDGASYDPASQTVSGHGKVAGGADTVVINGEVQDVKGEIPFTQDLIVTVMAPPARPPC